jgi:type IV pilus assembly protein PilB
VDDDPLAVLLEEGFTEEDLAKGVTLYKAVGCDQCNLGYKGRTGIYQVMPISEAMQKCILDGSNAMEIAAQAKKEGINDLRRSGLLKAMAGLTSLEEINRVTKD